MMRWHFYILLLIISLACNTQGSRIQDTSIDVSELEPGPFSWENAVVYFLLTDRFRNGDRSNDTPLGRNRDGALLRNFEGGDIKGITEKIRDGYFTDLGVQAIWFTPPVEQIHGFTDEGTGKTYGYHGYWARDWTAIDPNYGTYADLKEMVDAAHKRGIRVLLDVVINHTGPVTDKDSQWPDAWVRTKPQCTYQDFETTVTCTLVENLPDIRTESDAPVSLPPFLVEKWQREGRYAEEVAELDAFFDRTGLPRSPRHYIIKWLTDFVRELGIDGYRVDTVKHTEPSVWKELFEEAKAAFAEWKQKNPKRKLDDEEFFMVGEVYGYSIGHGKAFPMGGDMTINWFDYGFQSLINFDLKASAGEDLDAVFSRYSTTLSEGPLEGYGILNYISSHDDSYPFDPDRKMAADAITRLFLTPGAVQVYYGDETARPLKVEGAVGDANLRSMMNWRDLADPDSQASKVLEHSKKLGQFRRAHPAVGAGVHTTLKKNPYTFKRTLITGTYRDEVVVVVGTGDTTVDVAGIFHDGTKVLDYYSGRISETENGKVTFNTGGPMLLLAAAP